MKKIIIFIVTIIPIVCNAALFGPDNYEECVSDGVKGRSNAEIAMLQQKCLKKFPALPTVVKNRTAKISCSQYYSSNFSSNFVELTIYKSYIKSDNLFFQNYSKGKEYINAKSTQFINGENYTALLKLDYTTGVITIDVIPENSSLKSSYFLGTCSEKN